METGSALVDGERVPDDIVVPSRRVIPQVAVDDGDEVRVRVIADEPPNPLPELDHHFRDPHLHQGIHSNGRLVFDDGIRGGEGETEDYHVGQALPLDNVIY